MEPATALLIARLKQEVSSLNQQAEERQAVAHQAKRAEERLQDALLQIRLLQV